MAVYRRKFLIYPRKLKNQSIYYVQFRLPSGKLTTAKSSGETDPDKAKDWAYDYLESLKEQGINSKKKIRNMTFSDFSNGFFNFDSEWATDQIVKGRSITQRLCIEKTALLKNRIIPVFENIILRDISKAFIKDFRNNLSIEGLSGSFINKILSCIKTILEYAEDRDLVSFVPKIERCSRALNSKGRRGVLSPEEVQELFKLSWKQKPDFIKLSGVNPIVFYAYTKEYLAYLSNLISALTGLRQGELLALRKSSLCSGYIDVSRSWNQMLGVMNKTTKTGKTRFICIPEKLENALNELCTYSPYQNDDAFIFFSTTNDKPIQGHYLTNSLYDNLLKIGISKKERIERRITYHSWRHWLNSLLINEKIPLHKVRAIVGHSTDAMTENYYHADDMSDVRQVQESMLINGGLI